MGAASPMRKDPAKGPAPDGPAAFEPAPLVSPIAIVSDIHANLEALLAVEEHIQQQGINQIVCLGDVINYGADPEACIDRAMEYNIVLMGNHEDAVLTEAVGFNQAATQSADWTRRQLARGDPRRWSFIESLPLSHEEGAACFVHASPREPLMEYILPPSMCLDPQEGQRVVRDNLALVRGVCFVGHTHLPGVFLEDGTYLRPEEIGTELIIDGRQKLIVNAGSVGQPRDRDPRACYATYDGLTVRHHRVEYDVQQAMKKILDTPGLHPYNAVRLRSGE